MDNVISQINDLEDDKVYKVMEVYNQHRNIFPMTDRQIRRYCEASIFPGAYRMHENGQWLITGRDFKAYFKQQMEMFV